ncbi:MAG: efflux RND transporter periplasmic adaptor subunit, partial [Planctomycetales bacterium]|nr:efflux RND transporter periplasmic adaptor subunit [Planctomycetales bacterium]
MTAAKRRLDVVKIIRASGGWILALAGTVGVGILLAVFAGVLQPKVPPAASSRQRLLPADAKVVPARLIRRPRYETAVGSIEPIHQSSVAAKILAKVAEVNVTAGQMVKEGEVLVRLQDDDLQSRLKQAQAAHDSAVAHAEQARADYQRASRLIEGNAISRAEFESAATAVRTREAEVERSARAVDEAKVVLDYATIAAPYDGMVVDKQVQAGDTVQAGQTLLTLFDPGQMQLVANVRESLAMKLKIGQEVRAKLETLDLECSATVR